MHRSWVGFVFALFLLLGCSTRVQAQEVLTLPGGGFYVLGAERLDALGAFETAAVTMAPGTREAVLYLDGRPLRLYEPLTRDALARVKIFASSQASSVHVGLTLRPDDRPVSRPALRIRCINPFFRDTL